jgi:two-component system cell cycle response regulator
MEASEKQERAFRVLIAEDSATQRQIITMVLKREGLDVVVAEDGIEAVTQAYYERPDVVVLDIEMPKMNGYQVCRLLKEDSRTAHIPVIMLTSRDQETDKFWGLKTGADRYVTKDFKLTGLAAAVHEMLEKKTSMVDSGSKEDFEQGVADSEDIDVLSRVNDLLDRKLYEATIINEISKLNTLSEDSSITINSVLSVVAKVTDCYIGSVLLLEEKEIYLHVHSKVGKDFYKEAQVSAIHEAKNFLPAGTNSSHINVITDSESSLIDGEVADCSAIRSIISMPLRARGEVIGLLTLSSPKSDAFTDNIQQVLHIIEYPASVVIDNARLHDHTKKMAVTDGLTRLYNHRHFYELLEQEFHRTKRYQSNVALIMIDIDFFKQINDTYGHQVGDDILKELAEVIRVQVREVDILARYGGEEFAALLPQTSLEEAKIVAERIRSAVEENEFDTSKGAIKITVSLGLAGFPQMDINSQVELVSEADAALYRAKKAGKNRVVIGTGEEE